MSSRSVEPIAPQPLEQLKAFSQYVQGKSDIANQSEVIKLSSNECCFGPSPAAIQAYRQVASQLHRYPDGTQTLLRQALAKEHNIHAEQIVCGNGSEELIGLLMRCFLGSADELLLSENHFVMCSIYGKGQGADIVLAPDKDYVVDVDAILARITDRTKMVIIANPGVPAGTCLPQVEIQRLVKSIPEDILIVLDGAYAEYVQTEEYDSGAHLVEVGNNVVMTRTFSKIYGLAGLRIGWAYGPPAIIEVVNRLRTPFNASISALAAAEAAVGDTEHVNRVREHNTRWLERFHQAFTQFGLHVPLSVANFYLLDFGPRKDKSAQGAAAQLELAGIIPRPAGDDQCLRITVGTDAENAKVLDTLSAYLRN